MLRQWYEREKKKLTQMSTKQAAVYIWQYYKLWIIGVACLFFLIVYTLYTTLSAPTENWLYVVFANVPAETKMDEGSEFYDELAEYAGYDLSEKKLFLDTNCYCRPSEKSIGDHYYNKLVALLDGGIADAVVMDEENLLAVAKSGRLLDLQGEKYTIDDKWQSRLICYENTESDYAKGQIPVAVDLTGSRLTSPDGPYPDGCAIALSAASAHPEEFEMLLSFLFLEEQS